MVFAKESRRCGPSRPSNFFRGRDAGAVHEAMQVAEGLEREIDRGLRVAFAGDVGEREAGGAAEFRGEAFACGAIEVGNDDGAAFGSEEPRRGRAQSRCAAGDEKDVIADLHGKPCAS